MQPVAAKAIQRPELAGAPRAAKFRIRNLLRDSGIRSGYIVHPATLPDYTEGEYLRESSPFYGAAATEIEPEGAQRQVLTPGLMQMVSVLALNKLELKEMIDAEMVENPVLEEIDETVPMLDEVASRQEQDLHPERLERWNHRARRGTQRSFRTRLISGRTFRSILIRATAPSRSMRTAKTLV